MRTALLLLLALAMPAVATQTVWKWVDDKGVTHYSDVSVPGATKIELVTSKRSASPAPTYSAPTPQPSTPSEPKFTNYRELAIWKPGNDESVVNSAGVVDVSIRLDPEVQPGHTMYLYMDGQPVKDYPPNAAQYQLSDLPRGTHTLVAVISDENGRQLQQSTPVRFTVRQESIANPPVGPALRPPPKPTPRRQGQNKLPAGQPSYAALNGAQPTIDPATNQPVRPTAKNPHDPGPGK